MALYEAKTRECFNACMSPCPSFNLEVHAKIIQNQRNVLKSNNFQIIFGFKSITEYFTLTCEFLQKRWIISRLRDGEEIVIAETVDVNIKANLFYDILVQMRDNSLSIDINGLAVFTTVRFSDGLTLTGLVGVQAKVCDKYDNVIYRVVIIYSSFYFVNPCSVIIGIVVI